MRDPAAAVIVGTGDGALGASLDVAMVDRGQDVARTWPASPEVTMLQLDVRELVRGTPSPEVAMLEKKSRLDLGRLQGRAGR